MIRMILQRWMPIALMLSMAVNMFFAGLAVSHIGRPPPPPHGPPGPEGFFQRLAETLPAEDAAILRQAIDANRSTMQAEHEVRESFPQRIRTALLTQPFDPKALMAVFEETDGRERALRQRVVSALVDAAAAMSPEGRRRMAEFRPPHPPGPPGPPPGPGFGR